jgi:cytochrome c1
VIGTLPKTTAPKGVPAAGKSQFTASGCNACHTFKPAAATGKVGPDLDGLKQAAAAAKQPLAEFVMTSITDPNAYIAPGFKPNVMPMLPLTPQQVANLVAFLTKSS